MAVDAERCEEEETFNYNRNLVQVMKQHRLLAEEEEEELNSYLFMTQRCRCC